MNRKEIAEAKKEAVRKALQSVDVQKTTEGLCWAVDQPWCLVRTTTHTVYPQSDAMRGVLRRIGAVCNAQKHWYLP